MLNEVHFYFTFLCIRLADNCKVICIARSKRFHDRKCFHKIDMLHFSKKKLFMNKGCRQHQHDAFSNAYLIFFVIDGWYHSKSEQLIHFIVFVHSSFKIDVAIYFQSFYILPLFFPHTNISCLVHQFIIMRFEMKLMYFL